MGQVLYKYEEVKRNNKVTIEQTAYEITKETDDYYYYNDKFNNTNRENKKFVNANYIRFGGYFTLSSDIEQIRKLFVKRHEEEIAFLKSCIENEKEKISQITEEDIIAN
jgi:hypothetical protein